MGLITGFGRFVYDFIVGDAWEIAAGIVLVLALGILAMNAGVLAKDVAPIPMGAGIVLVVSLSLLWEGQKRIKGA